MQPVSLNQFKSDDSITEKQFVYQHARRRFWSEILTRQWLIGSALRYVPINSYDPRSLTIRMPTILPVRDSIPPDCQIFDRFASDINLFAEHIRQSQQPKNTHVYWVDEPDQVVPFSNFREFVERVTSNHVSVHGKEFLMNTGHLLQSVFASTPDCPSGFFCPADVALKNIFVTPEGLFHFDFEGAVVAPIEYFFVRCALNICRDLQGASSVSADIICSLLKQCPDLKIARTATLFSLVRMLSYRSLVSGPSLCPVNAIQALCAGADLESVFMIINEE